MTNTFNLQVSSFIVHDHRIMTRFVRLPGRLVPLWVAGHLAKRFLAFIWFGVRISHLTLRLCYWVIAVGVTWWWRIFLAKRLFLAFVGFCIQIVKVGWWCCAWCPTIGDSKTSVKLLVCIISLVLHSRNIFIGITFRSSAPFSEVHCFRLACRVEKFICEGLATARRLGALLVDGRRAKRSRRKWTEAWKPSTKLLYRWIRLIVMATLRVHRSLFIARVDQRRMIWSMRSRSIYWVSVQRSRFHRWRRGYIAVPIGVEGIGVEGVAFCYARLFMHVKNCVASDTRQRWSKLGIKKIAVILTSIETFCWITESVAIKVKWIGQICCFE